jgi:hypothetical protein
MSEMSVHHLTSPSDNAATTRKGPEYPKPYISGCGKLLLVWKHLGALSPQDWGWGRMDHALSICQGMSEKRDSRQATMESNHELCILWVPESGDVWVS